MPDNERARIRSIMYEPSKVWLATENSGDRWLTDQFVLYNVTEAEVVTDLPDGPYQLMATGAWRVQERDSIPEPDIEAYFGIVSQRGEWHPAIPSEWSVAEHPGKAMLWVSLGHPCLLGESTWTAISRHYPDVEVQYQARGNLFMFAEESVPFAFAAGIQIPEGQEDVAHAIAQALNRTSNQEAV